MNQIVIKELTSVEEWSSAFPVIHQLRTQLTEENYVELIAEMVEFERYKLFALFEESRVVAVIGFKEMTTFNNGRFIWVCDLVTDASKRSKGFGEMLLSYVHDLAKEKHYERVSLSSGLQRQDAHRFYQQKMTYQKTSYVFLKEMSSLK